MGKVTIIIPVFNEKRFISKTLAAVSKANTLNFNKEIIIVDDGSNDGTKDEIRKYITKSGKNLRVLFNTIFSQKNEGKGASIKKALLISTGDIVIIQDADLEYNPEDYPLLLEPFIKNNSDVVYGSRFISNRPHRVLYFWHYLINSILTTLSNMLTNLNLTDMETGSKAFRGEIIRKIAPSLKSKRFGFEPEITSRLSKIKGIRFYEIGISYSGRTYEEGKKINWKDGIEAVWAIFRFNLFP